MITPGGTKSFPVLRAYAHNGARFTGTLHTGGTYNGEFGAEVVWDDAGVIDESALKVEGSGKNAVVTVKTKDPGTSPNGGNAVVAIYKADDGTQTPVWSYHIWVTDYVPDGTNTATNNGYTFMNRNLGATFAGTGSGLGTGLFYQWGRKDPFPATGDTGSEQAGGGSFTAEQNSPEKGTVLNAIKNPSVYYYNQQNWLYIADSSLWGDNTVKTVYDPCPQGWRVASPNSFTGYTNGETSGGFNYGDNAKYPNTGLRQFETEAGFFGVGDYIYVWTTRISPTIYSQALSWANHRVATASLTNIVNACGVPVRCVRE
jgi:hypothetical protein